MRILIGRQEAAIWTIFNKPEKVKYLNTNMRGVIAKIRPPGLKKNL